MDSWPRQISSVLTVLMATLVGGCSSATSLLPSMNIVVDAATDAALEPATWGPLAGAAVLGVTGWDQDISDWATDENPVYDNEDRARTASDNLQYGLVAGMLASSIFAPGDDGFRSFPSERVAANVLAFGSANAAVAGLKEAVGRERPDGSDSRSFPSGHAVAAFSSAALIDQNLNETITSPLARASVRVGAYGLASATAWARVEGNKHYPVDVLVSAAIGNFFAKAFYRALVAPGDTGHAPITVEAGPDILAFRFSRQF